MISLTIIPDAWNDGQISKYRELVDDRQSSTTGDSILKGIYEYINHDLWLLNGLV